MKLTFNLFGRRVILAFQIVKRPTYWTSGLTSRIPGTTYHVHLMDYDIIRYDFLEVELGYLQEAFGLGDFLVFKTRDEGIHDGAEVGGYHALCLDIDVVANILMVLRSSNCDYAFINAPRRNPERAWVLRIDDKGSKRPRPEFIGTLESECSVNRLQSTFHARLLDDWYGLDVEETLINPDGNENGFLHYYNTAKRVEK